MLLPLSKLEGRSDMLWVLCEYVVVWLCGVERWKLDGRAHGKIYRDKVETFEGSKGDWERVTFPGIEQVSPSYIT